MIERSYAVCVHSDLPERLYSFMYLDTPFTFTKEANNVWLYHESSDSAAFDRKESSHMRLRTEMRTFYMTEFGVFAVTHVGHSGEK